MRRSERSISLLIIAALFGAAFIAAVFFPSDSGYSFPQVPDPIDTPTTDLSSKRITAGDDFEPAKGTTGSTNYKDKEMLVDDSFTTHLPLVVIDTGGKDVPRSVKWDSKKRRFVPTGVEPYVSGSISVIDSDDGLNTPLLEPETQSECKLKVRGNTSSGYDKRQYLVKMLNDKGELASQDVLDMGAGREWVLNVSFADKSLLRNYLAYSTAGEIMPYTPDARYCEVLWKDGDTYRYEGVYLIMESVSVGKQRVDLPKYSENSPTTPALLRRDRWSDTKPMIDNYGTREDLTEEFLDIEYPDADVLTQKGIDNITKQVDRFETALYSDDWDEFVHYRDYVDMQSFVDYFILNEYFLNYDAGYHSTYFYMDYSGKLHMGPVWDFDQAMDNVWTTPSKLDTTAFHSAPWFNRMLRDPEFTEALIERYAELRKSILSDESIRAYVEQTIDYLGPAIERDWARWGYYYTNGGYLQPEASGVDRNTKSYREEVEKILSVLSEHGAWMDEHLDSLYQFKAMPLDDAKVLDRKELKDYRPALAVVFVVAILVSVKLVLDHERE